VDKPVPLYSKLNVSDGNWHVITSYINRNDFMLKVDEERKITSQAGGRGLNSWGKSKLYLGGVERSMEERLLRTTGNKLEKGLTGCIDDVIIERGIHRMNTTMGNAKVLHRISDCSSKHPCNPNPCQHGADCLVANNEKDILSAEVVGNADARFTSFCQCSVLYTGKFCQVPTNLTDPCLFDPCAKGEVCRAKSDFSTFECLCNQGSSCSQADKGIGSKNIDLSKLLLSNTTTISFVFKAHRQNGLLFSNSNSTKLLLENGKIKMNISKTLYIIPQNISLEEWTTVDITSGNNKINLLVDDKPFIINNSEITLDSYQPIIIGNLSINSSSKPTNSSEVSEAATFKTFSINDVDMINTINQQVSLEDTKRQEDITNKNSLDVNEIN